MDTSKDRYSFPRGVELVADTVINGLKFHVPAGVTTIMVGGVSYPIADLVKLVETLSKPYKEIRAARALLRQASEDRPKFEGALKTLLAELECSMASVVGRTSEELRHFGFQPRRPRRKLTAEEWAASRAKATLTRALNSGRATPPEPETPRG